MLSNTHNTYQSWVTNKILRQQHLQHPHPLNHLHQHRQQCFWTDTSVLAQAGAPEEYAACSVCDPSGFSCTTVNEPLAAWTVAIETEKEAEEPSDDTNQFESMCSQHRQPYGAICEQLHALH